jgi:magnesium transporter
MLRVFRKQAQKAGLAPGSLVHIGEKKAEKVTITLFDYDETSVREKEVESIEECFSYRDSTTVTWINIDGLHEVDVIEKLGTHYNLHPLTMEDILHTGQRPKMEDMEEYIFLVLKMYSYDKEAGRIWSEQISLILGAGFVLSFQEAEGDTFNAVRDRIRKAKGRIRRRGPDYLVYALIDSIVDEYFLVLETFGEEIQTLEKELTEDPSQETLHTIHNMKQEIVFLRKSVWPLREAVNNLERAESPLITDALTIFLRDLYDHIVQVIDVVETYQDVLTGMQDLYLSSVSNRMNEVMKVLTIFASIFIPLTFVAGIYGMNFEFMPELKWRWSYPILWAFIITAGVGMLSYFKRKKWL